MVARPASACNRVARIRTAVVLPAPLGPRTPRTVPSRAARSTPSSAWVVPKRFVRPSASTMLVLMVVPLSCWWAGQPRAPVSDRRPWFRMFPSRQCAGALIGRARGADTGRQSRTTRLSVVVLGLRDQRREVVGGQVGPFERLVQRQCEVQV